MVTKVTIGTLVTLITLANVTTLRHKCIYVFMSSVLLLFNCNKTGMCGHILVTASNVILPVNPSGESQVVPCWHTHRRTDGRTQPIWRWQQSLFGVGLRKRLRLTWKWNWTERYGLIWLRTGTRDILVNTVACLREAQDVGCPDTLSDNKISKYVFTLRSLMVGS